MVKHLSDDEVQQFVVDEQNCEATIVDHTHICSECKMKVEVYRSLIAGIIEQPEPAFDFDLSTLVLQELPSSKQKTSDKMLLWILIFISVGLIGTGLYFYQGYLTSLFEGLTSIIIYLVVVTAIAIMVFLFVDLYKKYNKEMKLLDS